MNEDTALTVLSEVASIPTAPLHEEGVAAYVTRFLRDLGLPFQADPFGNLIATYRRGDGALPVAFVAHLDHPGLEITAVGPGRIAQAALLGGVPPDCFDRPVPATVMSDAQSNPATIVGYDLHPGTRRVASLKLECTGRVSVGDFGIFDLPGFQREGDEIALRVADDLAGVAASLLALKQVVDSSVDGTVFGIFTRAEEIGLVGAALVAQQRLLPADTIVVSLECSRELPGAQSGNGPVIRVGDRARAFHPDGEALLLAARERIHDVPIQRQLMSGGVCEATAFGAAGYRTTGVALPLINYHNVGPDDVIAPERINVRDFLGEIALLVAGVEAAAAPRPLTIDATIQQRIQQHQERLQNTAVTFQKL